MSESKSEALFDPPLWMQRRVHAGSILTAHSAHNVFDMGCGEGAMLGYLSGNSMISKLTGVDIWYERLVLAGKALEPTHHDHEFLRETPLEIDLYHGSILDIEPRDFLFGFDACVCLEVIEHLQPETVDKFGENLLAHHRAPLVILSTPNAEFNVKFVMKNKFRDHDHKFEWTRQQFETWCSQKAQMYDYTVQFSGVGVIAALDSLGYCTQFATFTSNQVNRDGHTKFNRVFHTTFPYFDRQLSEAEIYQVIANELPIIHVWNASVHPDHPNSLALDSIWRSLSVRQCFRGESAKLVLFLHNFKGDGFEFRDNCIVLSQEYVNEQERLFAEREAKHERDLQWEAEVDELGGGFQGMDVEREQEEEWSYDESDMIPIDETLATENQEPNPWQSSAWQQ